MIGLNKWMQIGTVLVMALEKIWLTSWTMILMHCTDGLRLLMVAKISIYESSPAGTCRGFSDGQ